MEKKTMRFAIAAILAFAGLTSALPAQAAGELPPLPPQNFSFDGVFGRFDRAQLQRGLKVYLGVCATCHGLKLVAYRNLTEIGLTPLEARAVAATKKVKEIGPDGEIRERPAELKDRFVSPFANDAAAATANGGALPPDLSLITKARVDGTNYLPALLTGYQDPPPADWKDDEGKPRKLEGGQYYNKFYPGHVIAMAPPLTSEGNGGTVEYPANGPKPTVEQMAKDVTAFLAWAAEPTMEERKRTGIKVMLFLLIFTGVFWAAYKRIWRKVH